MASTIEEIPIESGPIADVDAGAEEPAAPEPVPKRRGRPKGSRNRPKEVAPAQRAEQPSASTVPKKKKASAARAPSPSSSEEEEAPPPKRSTKRRAPSPGSSEEERPQQQPLDSRAVAAEVLHMLSQRHVDQRQAKREKYRSWFH